MLAVWDWLFGSLHFSETGKKIRFGLRPNEASATNILQIYLRPFIDIFKALRVGCTKVLGLLKTRLTLKNF
jgi:hypothetical protein